MLPTAIILLLTCSAAPAAAVMGPGDFDGSKDVTFYLYTMKNRDEPQIIQLGVDTSSPNFNVGRPTRFIFHGAFANSTMYLEIKDAYFDAGKDYNVVMVDWSSVAALPEMVAMETTWKVGDYVGSVINDMIERRKLKPDDVFIVGHSMGGQLAGIVGNRVGNGAVAQVIGLDPASDIYDNNSLENQIDASDAQFVQIIHTNGPGLGIPDPRGSVDFIVNDGTFQPGCEDWHTPGMSPEGDDACSHLRVVDLFIESISSHELVATQCGNYDDFLEGYCDCNDQAVMGEDAPNEISGVFYIETHAVPPYGVGYLVDDKYVNCGDVCYSDNDDDENDDDGGASQLGVSLLLLIIGCLSTLRRVG